MRFTAPKTQISERRELSSERSRHKHTLNRMKDPTSVTSDGYVPLNAQYKLHTTYYCQKK